MLSAYREILDVEVWTEFNLLCAKSISIQLFIDE